MKKSLNIILLIVSATLIGICFVYLEGDGLKPWCFGIGAGFLGFSVSNLVMLYWSKKYPKEMKQAEIDYKDERSEIIRNKAKARSSDIIQWTIMAVAWITILADFALWITVLLVGVFLLKTILELILMNKYNNEM
ncbi:hypothetical protein [Anaerotignum sp. MB30-C6]|uniref:hypothetical protein n=1 Tax=Anaerotignum sp. MB30-C6 TaxID=3070814 RepID=UPI0027DC6462|nr:hypothetical protein [Anaerotignum sp. MB30-C6]WMI80786.1 hypothetical protein RBQ60_13315 [Anaerotignum sp. MB30-C6]